MRGTPKKSRMYLFKTCVFILTCLNFSPLERTLRWTRYTYEMLFRTQSSFELISADAFRCFCHFLCQLFHIDNTFPSEDFFTQGNEQEKCHSG